VIGEDLQAAGFGKKKEQDGGPKPRMMPLTILRVKSAPTKYLLYTYMDRITYKHGV
jgi:hypothetical protein